MNRIEGQSRSSWERLELSEHLAERGEYGLADKVRRGDCLHDSELRRTETIFEEDDLVRRFDYRVETCDD